MKKVLTAILLTPYNIWAALWWIVFCITLFPVAIIISLTFKGLKGTKALIAAYGTWFKIYNALVFIRIKVTGLDNIDYSKAHLLVANHTSFVDMLAIGATIKFPVKPIAKAELGKIPVLGSLFRLSCIMVNRKNEESRKQTVVRMRQAIDEGISIFIFAEGTRNRTNEVLIPFKDGAFRISFDTGADILPAVIFNAKKLMPPGGALRPGKVHIHYLPPVNIKGFSSTDELKQHVYNIMHAALVNKVGS